MKISEVVFWASRNVIPFTGATVDEKGSGGAERALAEIATRLSDHFEKVTVYEEGLASAGLEGAYGGVSWVDPLNVENMDHKDYAFIAWRNPWTLNRPRSKILCEEATAKVLWVHDPSVHSYVESPWQHSFDQIVCVSDWHRHYFLSRHNVPGRKVRVIENGLDPLEFVDVPGEKKNRVVYASSPMRGLEILLDVWPAILERVADAELHIYYGFDDWTKLGGGLKAHNLEEMVKQMSFPHGESSVRYHGRVSPSEMVKAFYASKVLAYPSIYPETYCLTALEAQAAGCVPVTSMLGNLPYVVFAGEQIDGDINDDWKVAFAESVVRLLQDETLRLEKAGRARAEALKCTWDLAAETWANLLTC